MKKLRNHLIGIDQGEEALFSDFENGGEMWAATGPRERRKKVAFSDAFRAAPNVQVSIALLDTDCGTNVRAEVKAEAVTAQGFELVFRTWSDTRVARVRLSWLAIGEAAGGDEEEWQLY